MTIQTKTLPCVLGLPAEEAARRLQNAGAAVQIGRCASRGGVMGADSLRVIRQTEQAGVVLLMTSAFRCTPLPAEGSLPTPEAAHEPVR